MIDASAGDNRVRYTYTSYIYIYYMQSVKILTASHRIQIATIRRRIEYIRGTKTNNEKYTSEGR